MNRCRAFIQAGAGIVADSVPESEHQECWNKARALLRAAEEAVTFHTAMKRACDAHDPAYYEKFKPWADTYFFLPHRGVARGVGGIFFDYLNSGDFARAFAFSSRLDPMPTSTLMSLSRSGVPR